MENKILELLKKQDLNEALNLANKLDSQNLSTILNKIDKSLLKDFIRGLDSELLAETLLLLEKDQQEEIINSLPDIELDKVMDEISLEDTVDIIQDMPYEVVFRIAETEEILKLLENKNYTLLKELLSNMNPIDIANIFDEIKEEEFLKIFRLLPKDLASDTFIEMSTNTKELLISKLNDKEIKAVIDDLFLDDAVDFIEEMPANVVKRVLAQSDIETRKYINEILKYPVDSAGSIMTIEYVSLHANMTVKESLESIRKKAIDKETIYTCYVTDNTNKLIGVITAKDLLINSDNLLIDDIMNKNVIYVHTEDDKEIVARTISKYGFLALPVVDRENRMVGIVTIDDAIDVLQEETDEDISKMAAILPTDKTYLEMKPFEIWKNRIPWLLVLLISATFTGLIITNFEEQLNQISTLLFACVPMMMDTGGNSGSQASVTIIRGMATGELKLKDTLKIIWKELRVSVLLGLTLSAACFLKLLLIDKLIFGQEYTLMICLVVSLALFITVVVAKIVGAILPLLAKALKLDPAVVASPFITTIVDAISLILYCLLAINLL